AFGKYLRIANFLCFFAIGGVIYSFVRYEGYLYTDEAHLIMNICLLFLYLYFLLRCPDFLKSLADTAFKRISLGGKRFQFRIHETFLGILLVFGGVLLIINSYGGDTAYFEGISGLFPLTLGTFIIGRDWKDFAQGKFLRD
ncbi:MAG: hypothetical protein ACTSWY_14580, partial [Promethearchaeota archaeon]